MTKFDPQTENLQWASAFAQVFTDRINQEPSLIAQWKQNASPQAQQKLADAKQSIFLEGLSVAAADKKEKIAAITKLFNAMIHRTEIVAEVLVKADATAEQCLVDVFNEVKADPRFATLDLGTIYDTAKAPTLAAAARKARAPKN